MKAIGSRDDVRKVEYYIPLSWSTRVSLRRRVTVFRLALKTHKPYKFHYGTSAPPLNDPFRLTGPQNNDNNETVYPKGVYILSWLSSLTVR